MGGSIKELAPDKYLVSNHYIDSSNGQQGLDVRHINGQGLTLKRKRYLFKNDDFLSFLSNKFQTDISNSSILITGGSFTNNMSTVVFLSLNKETLDTNWVKYYYDGNYSYHLNSVFRVRSNEFWLFGNKFNNSGFQFPFALKVDTLGNIISSKTFTALSDHNPRDAYYDSNTDLIYFNGVNYTIPQAVTAFVVCSDTTGNILWNQQNYGPVSLSQIEKNNNYLVIASAMYAGDFSPSNPTYLLDLLKINATNGNVIWHKQYGSRKVYNSINAFVINNDESITATGCYFYESVQYGGQSDGVLLKVNSSGDSLWMQTYSNNAGIVQEALYDIKKTNDGGFIMGGTPFFSQSPNQQAWVVKTDSLGIAPGLSTNIRNSELTQDNLIKVYPNPVKNKIHIDSKISFHSLRLTNTLGQTILQPDDVDTKQLDLSDLPSGLYFLHLITHGNDRCYKVIKE